NTEVEVLNLVGISLRDRERIVKAQRTERRSPHQADTCRSTKLLVVAVDRRTALRGVVAVKRCSVCEHGATDTQTLRNQWHGELNFSRTIDVGRATHPVTLAVRSILIRTDTIELEATNDVRIVLEQVEDTDAIITKFMDITTADAQHADDIGFLRKRLVV